jgi:hypothetical protein
MTTMLSAAPNRQTTTTPRPHPLLAVMAWELRRLRANRLSWAIPLIVFSLLLIDFWPARTPHRITVGDVDYWVAGTSAWGLVDLLATRLFLLLALMLPFVCVDSVALDVKRRTHELLMATTLPSWAYIWGRYLTTLLLGLGLALVLLADLLALGFWLPLLDPPYAAPEVGNTIILWAVIVVPATILISSVSFALGAWLPHHSNIVKVGVLIVWLGWTGIFTVLTLPGQPTLSNWFLALDPTSNGFSGAGDVQYFNTIFQYHFSATTPGAQIAQAVLAVEQRLPDLSAWLAAQLVWTALGVAAVVLVTRFFKRFRTA